MMKLKSVQGHPGLARDPVSGAIININSNEIDRAKKVKKASQNSQKRIDKLEQDIGEIKSILLKMLEEKHGDHTN
jgi:hypothetical protein